VLFAVPWLGALVLGTTDTPRQDLPREPRPFDHEVEFILREAGQVLARAPQRADVRSVWVGLRPLVAAAPQEEGTPRATKRLSREHTIVTDPSGLITVTGGKWTTYRAMAEDVLDACFREGTLPKRTGRTTRTHRLVGAPEDVTMHEGGSASGEPGSTPPISAAPGLHLYGTEADTVRALPGADRTLGLGLTEAMVRFAARHEYALTVEDMLARRWRALFLDARAAARMAPAVAEILAEETGVDPRLGDFLTLAGTYTLA
jgi:glycerol-3-phosphate dehydrogenase